MSCAILLACVVAAGGARGQDLNAFTAATAAFAARDYARALGLFEAALAAGADSAALHYNLGVCQYRVGEYARAAATFAGVRERFPAFAALAEYNRGLALLALDDQDTARAAFAYAHREGDDPLQALAADALTLLEAETTAGSHWLSYFDLAAGHDDNVALVDELSLPATASASSPFAELVGTASRRFELRVPLRLALSGYLVRYLDATQFDQESLRVDAALLASVGDWRFETGPHVAQTRLDGDGFERAFGVTVQALRPLSERTALEARLVYDDIDAPSERFTFVAGSRQRLRIGLDRRTNRQRLRVWYELEANDRASANVSPSRQRLAVGLQRPLGGPWSLDATVAYRRSEFDELTAPREERLTEVVATARRDLGRGWLLGAEYRLADNDSNVAQFGYRSHRIGVAVGRSF